MLVQRFRTDWCFGNFGHLALILDSGENISGAEAVSSILNYSQIVVVFSFYVLLSHKKVLIQLSYMNIVTLAVVYFSWSCDEESVCSKFLIWLFVTCMMLTFNLVLPSQFIFILVSDRYEPSLLVVTFPLIKIVLIFVWCDAFIVFVLPYTLFKAW